MIGVVDPWILRALREPQDLANPLGPEWLEEAARDVTALGGSPILFLATIAITIQLYMNGAKRLAAFAIVSISGAQVASETLKAIFARPRPDLVPHEVAVYSASFPSGHAMLAAAAYFTLAFVLARRFTRKRNRIALYISAGALTFVIGVSRIYLGVHWPSDVLGGWVLGVTWAIAGTLIYKTYIASKNKFSRTETD